MVHKKLFSIGTTLVFMLVLLGVMTLSVMTLGVVTSGEVVAQDAGQAVAQPDDLPDNVSPNALDSAPVPSFWSLLFDKGGLVTWVIALLSAVGLPIAIVKIYQFVQMDIWRPQALNHALQNIRSGRVEGMAQHFNRLAHPAAPLIGYALAEAHGGAMAVGVLREELTRRAQFLIRHLARHIWILELIAASAPLFGLLGTVLGMIVAFQGVGQGSGGADTGLLAAGIWEALLTTAFGLGVALPFSILAAVFNNAVDEVRDLIEDAVTEILVRSESLPKASSDAA